MNADRGGCSVILVGLMGTGKSSVARVIAAELGVEAHDTDRMVEAASGRRVRDLFVEGEETFRDIEARELRACLDSPVPCVVAAAGGVVIRDSNRLALNEERRRGRAFVAWLRADTDTLVSRTRRGVHRPLLDESPGATLREMEQDRTHLYESVSDVDIDTSGLTVEQVARLVVDAMRRRAGGSRMPDGFPDGADGSER